MKKPRIADALEYIEDDMITEAVTYKPEKNRMLWIRWAAVAACLCLIAAVKIRNPGMGDARQVYNIVADRDSVYYSVYDEGAFLWNPTMKKAQKLAEDGRFFETESGIILYSELEDSLWQVSGNKLSFLGNTHIQDALDSPLFIGICGDYAYWVGNRRDLEKEEFGMAVVRTSLHNGKAESLIKSENSSISDCAIRGDTLYYLLTSSSPQGSIESLYARNVETGEEMRLREMKSGADGISGKLFYGEKYIIMVSGSLNGIYKIAYNGGEAQLLTQAVPVSSAIDEHKGKICFATSFGENESEEFLSGKGFYRQAVVSVDVESGELSEFKDFELDNDNGTVRYTITELQMADNGFYFVDPHHGLLFHSFADGSDRSIS